VAVRVLVIEDEPAIADFVQRGLEAEGYQVTTVGDGIEGERRALAEPVDLVVLDRMLPGRDGMSVLARLRREKPALPVIVLSARAEIEDRVAGLDAGATDYLVKPFSFDELAARVRAHLRLPVDGEQEQTQLSAGDVVLDLLSRRVTQGEREVHLPAREFELLAHFMRHPGQALSREQLLAAVWGYDFDPQTNVVDVYVSYLRRKVCTPESSVSIDTLRSVGYRFSARD
jgi:two-component system copper resistance phosphate regulon response regulator CusR